jgi:predicted RNA-binding Zn ribbon-like protein
MTLEDLAPEDRKSLAFDHPLLDEYATRMEAEHTLPAGMLRALKDAGENAGVKSGSVRSTTTSPKGAQGVMQFMPGTAKRMNVTDPTDPLEAIAGAGRYVKHIMGAIGTEDPALLAAAYNAGENRASLKAGNIPAIPETQKYAARVSKFMESQPAQPIDTQALSIGDLAPEDRKAARPGAGRQNATDGMSRTELMLAGAGKSMVDAAQGAKQLAAEYLVNPVSRKVVGRDLIDPGYAAEAERRAQDADLVGNPWGLAGYAGGTAATMALPGGAVARLGPVAAATRLAGRLPGALGRVAGLGVPAAATGAALGAAAPIAAESERGANAVLGAVTGPLASLAGSGVGKVASAVASRIPQGLKDLVPDVLSRPSWLARAVPAERAAVERALAADVPVYGSQLRTPGKTLSVGRGEAQSSAFDKAIAKTFGQETDDLVAAFQNAPRDIGAKYDAALGNKVIALGKDHLNDLAAVGKFNAARSPRFAPDSELRDAVQRATQAAKASPTMTAQDYQASLREYTAAAKAARKGTELRPSNPHAAEGFDKLAAALTTQAEKTMTGEELALFRQANKEWRNMSLLDSLAPRDAAGNINPKQLANLLARKDKSNFVKGSGDQTLADLARFGNTYMGLDKRSPTGPVQQAKRLVSQAAPFLAADLGGAAIIGSQLDHGGNPEDGLVTKALPYGLGLGAAMLAVHGGQRMLDPRLTRQILGQQGGALTKVFRDGATPALTGAVRTADQ